MIYVIATVEINPGMRPAFLEEFHRLMPLVHAEQGCIEYQPAGDVRTGIAAQTPFRENTITILEKWASLDDLNAHLVAPHMVAYRGRVQGFVARVSLQVLAPT